MDVSCRLCNSEQYEFRSYVHLLATVGVFSTIVPSYVIYVNRPHKFPRTVRSFRETGSCS